MKPLTITSVCSTLLPKEVIEQNKTAFEYYEKSSDIYQRTKKAMGHREPTFKSVSTSTSNFKPKTDVFATTH